MRFLVFAFIQDENSDTETDYSGHGIHQCTGKFVRIGISDIIHQKDNNECKNTQYNMTGSEKFHFFISIYMKS